MDAVRPLIGALAAFLSGTAARPVDATGQDVAVRAVTVRTLLDAGRYADAEAEARTLTSAEGPRPPSGTSPGLQLLVEALIHNGRGAEAETQVLAEALRPHTPDGAAPLESDGTNQRLLGEVLFESGRYHQAAAALRAATQLDERAFGSRSARVSIDLEALARAAAWADQHEAASAAIDRAVDIANALGDTPRLAKALATRGLIWHRRGSYPRARVDLERALVLRRQLGLDHPASVVPLALYGDQLWFDSELPRARDYIDQAVAIASRSLRPGHPQIAECLRILGITLDDLGEIDAAKAGRERAVAIAAEAYGREHPQYALQLHDLALSFMKRGDYREARRLLLEALRIYEQGVGRAHSEIGSTLHNLGTLAASLGDFGDAARLQRRAAASWERSLGASHPVLPWAWVALADALASQGKDVDALPILRRALATRERVLGRDHIQVAATLNPLSKSLASLRQLDRAAPLADRAIGIWENSGGAEGLSDALLIRARIESERHDHVAARRDYERALAVRLPVFGDAHPSIGDGRIALASTLAALDRRADAFALALDGERIGRDHVRLTVGYLSESQALGYASSRARGLDLALSVLESSDDAARAFDAVIRGRSVVLDEMATRQRLRASTAGSELEPLWAVLAAASRRLANLAVRGPGDSDSKTYATLLARAEREKAQAEAALAERSATARRELTRRQVGLDELRADLPPRSAIVSFIRYDHRTFTEKPSGTVGRSHAPAYAAFVVNAGGREPVLIRLGRAVTIDAAIERWRTAATSGVTPSGDVVPGAERALRSVGAALRSLIWDPLQPALADATQIYLVPDGALNLVPFGALPMDGGSYLVDARATLHYLSAERDLVEFDTPARVRGQGLLAVGGPAYGQAPAPKRPATSSNLAVGQDTGASLGGRRSSCGTFDTMTFSALPASRREAEEIGALWRSLGATATGTARALVLTGGRANEGDVKAASRGTLVLHVATHGFFLGGDCRSGGEGTRGVGVKGVSATAVPARRTPLESPLLRSGLALAGANRRVAAGPNDEDGILTAEEVAALDLDGVEWAVLSACETGLGQIRGGEGVFGLRRAFRTAGARTVIMSLWPVEDRAARSWMRALYEGRLRQKLSTIEAMRHASATILAERRAKRLSTHPFFWAGFVAAGDWR